MGTTKRMVRGFPFPSLGSVPSLRHCTARKKANLIEFRRYPAWHFLKGCLRGILWLHQTSAAKRASFPEMGTNCSTHKRFLSFWLCNWWCKVSDCRDGVVRSAGMGWWGLHDQLCLGTWGSLVQLQDGWRHCASHCSLTGWRGFLNSAPLNQRIQSLKCMWSM